MIKLLLNPKEIIDLIGCVEGELEYARDAYGYNEAQLYVPRFTVLCDRLRTAKETGEVLVLNSEEVVDIVRCIDGEIAYVCASLVCLTAPDERYTYDTMQRYCERLTTLCHKLKTTKEV